MDKLQKIVSLAKRRGFIFPGSEIYGGLANTWDWGPLGVELVNNVKKLWWERFVTKREDIFGLQSGILMNSKVWEASGHLKNFTDPLAECEDCHRRFRYDAIIQSQIQNEDGSYDCPYIDIPLIKGAKGKNHGKLSKPRQFNLMFKTFIGPVESEANTVYLRPETAQGMFINFKNVLDTMRPKLPFGIAQIGKAFRNEITPGNFIFRVLEFEQMEIEYFIKEKDWRSSFEDWQKEMKGWLDSLGIKGENYHLREHQKDELSHYAEKTVDFEYDFPFGVKELYGLAYRADFDLKAHGLEYTDPVILEKFTPHVIEPTFGLERTILALLLDSYFEEEKRVVLKLAPRLAPYQVAVFPLLANKPELVKLAREVYDNLRQKFSVAFDNRGNIGKRYLSQDEIGTPWCVTIDFESLKRGDATVRDRDTTGQERVKREALKDFIARRIGGN